MRSLPGNLYRAVNVMLERAIAFISSDESLGSNIKTLACFKARLFCVTALTLVILSAVPFIYGAYIFIIVGYPGAAALQLFLCLSISFVILNRIINVPARSIILITETYIARYIVIFCRRLWRECGKCCRRFSIGRLRAGEKTDYLVYFGKYSY